MKYYLQNRHQDEGWKNLDIEFDDIVKAVKKASKLSKNAICYGMVRVINEKEVVATFAAGGGRVES